MAVGEEGGPRNRQEGLILKRTAANPDLCEIGEDISSHLGGQGLSAKGRQCAWAIDITSVITYIIVRNVCKNGHRYAQKEDSSGASASRHPCPA